jgi:hypothetical protein
MLVLGERGFLICCNVIGCKEVGNELVGFALKEHLMSPSINYMVSNTQNFKHTKKKIM